MQRRRGGRPGPDGPGRPVHAPRDRHRLPDHLDRGEHRWHAHRSRGDRAGRRQLPQLRTRPIGGRADLAGRPHRRQRALPRGADHRACGGQPPARFGNPHARRPHHHARQVEVRLLLPRLGRTPEPAPVAGPAPRPPLRGARPRRFDGPRPRRRPRIRRELRGLWRAHRGARRGHPGSGRNGPGGQPPPPHLPRLVGLLRGAVRTRGRRRRRALRLLRTERPGGCGPDRPTP